MNHLRLSTCLFAAFVVCGMGIRSTQAQQDFVTKVPGLKADSLVVMGYYFKWPANAVAGGDFIIGILGDASFTSQRVTQRFRKVGNKSIRVLSFDSANDYQPCHILFVADEPTARSVEKTAEDRLAAVLEKLQGAPVLIVTETEGFATRGAMANFVVNVDQNRVNVEVNEAAVRIAQLGFTRFYLDFRKTARCILIKDDLAEAEGAGS